MPVRPTGTKEGPIKSSSPKFTEQQKADLDALRDMPDEEINYSDIPETVDWSAGQRSAFYQPVKRETVLTLDRFVIDWFKSNTPDGQDYHETVNLALLEHIKRMRHTAGKASDTP